MLPMRATIDGAEDAAFAVGSPLPAHRGHVDDVRILRMNDDLADMVRLAKAHVRPRLATIHRLEDTRARIRITGIPRLCFTSTNPDHIRFAA